MSKDINRAKISAVRIHDALRKYFEIEHWDEGNAILTLAHNFEAETNRFLSITYIPPSDIVIPKKLAISGNNICTHICFEIIFPIQNPAGTLPTSVIGVSKFRLNTRKKKPRSVDAIYPIGVYTCNSISNTGCTIQDINIGQWKEPDKKQLLRALKKLRAV